jgi:hypothetical protein
LSTGATVAILFAGTQEWTDYGTNLHNPASNSDKWYLKWPGRWQVQASLDYDGHATGTRGIIIRRNGTTSLISPRAHSAANQPLRMQTILEFNNTTLTDWLDICGFQNSGGTLGVNGPSINTFGELKFLHGI